MQASPAGEGRGEGNPTNTRNAKHNAYGIKKLRELILELAVRGKLVSQDSNDEPARVLLGQIALEKARLVKEGKIKKQNSLPEINDDEKSFELPSGWEWVRLQDVSAYIQRGKGPKYADRGQVRVISQKCIQWNGFDSLQAKYVDDDSITSYQPERFLVENDLLWNSTGTGTVGRINVLAEVKPNSLVADSHVTVIRPLNINSNFIWCYISAPGIQQRIEPGSEKTLVSGTTNQVELNTSEVVRLVLPIPPLAEQHRIVAKVDELMALCDQLEQQQTDNIAAHQTLVQTLLDALIARDGGYAENTGAISGETQPAEFQQAWSRIADHFDTLFTTESSIDQLKQTLLQLAVMGKLVPQDLNDEPASILLEKIAQKQRDLLREGKIKKTSSLCEVKEGEKAFEIPESWKWVKLGEIVCIRGGKRVSNGYQLLSIPTPYIYIRVSDMSDGTIDDSDLKYIDDGMYSKISQYIITKDDIYMTIVGATIGKCGLVPDRFDGANLTENAARLTPFIVSKHFLYKTLSTSFCQNQFIDKTKQVGVQKMALNRLADTLIPLPPLAEQHRIVAKVDELMALCDALTASIAAAQTTQLQLADAIVEQAVA